MSMIESQLQDLETLKAFIVLKCNADVTCKEARKPLQIIDEAITTIKELSAKLSAVNMERSSMYYNGGWIEFKQKYDESEKRYVFDCSLPKDGQRILISLNPKKEFENVQADMFYEDCGECYLDSGYEIVDDVLAWQPLPKPYKSKESREGE